MKFSIIIPVYNAESYLNKCIGSILEQSYGDFELILVDDGSVDSSGLICDQICSLDPRVIVYHKGNGGVSSARNLGIEKATGEYIVFIDADDYVGPDYLHNFSKYDSECIICGAQKFGGSNGTEMLLQNEYEGIRSIAAFINDGIYKSIIRTPWAKAIRRDVILNNDINFNPKVKLGEDTLFALECYSHCNSIQTIDKIGYFYKDQDDICSKYKISFEEYRLFLKSITRIADSYKSQNAEISKALKVVIPILKIVYENSLYDLKFLECVKDSILYVKNGTYKYECYPNKFYELKACLGILSFPFRRFIYDKIFSNSKSKS